MGAAVVDVEPVDPQDGTGAPPSMRRRENQLIGAGLRPCRSPAPRRRSRSRCGVPCLSTRPLCMTVTCSTTRSAMSRSCSMMTKPMCSRQRRSSATSSRRSPGDRPAAGSSNRIRRGAPANAMPISSWRCWPCDRSTPGARATDCRRTRSSSSSVASARGMRRAWPEEVEAPARYAAHGEEKIVADRQVAEQQRRLIGASQSHADALVGRHLGHVLAEEAHAAGGRREVAGDDVEQRRLAGAVGAEHGPALAGRHRERDVVDGAQRAERRA